MKWEKKSPEIHSHIYDQLIFNEGTKETRWKKESTVNGAETIKTCDNKKITSICISHQIQKLSQNESHTTYKT